MNDIPRQSCDDERVDEVKRSSIREERRIVVLISLRFNLVVGIIMVAHYGHVPGNTCTNGSPVESRCRNVFT